MINTGTVSTAPDYEDPLEPFGIKEHDLLQLGEKILTAYRQATPNDAVTAQGSLAYYEGVRALRDLLCPQGWKKTTKNNLEITTSPDKKISIVVSSGNQYTGNSRIEPSTKNRKGKQTKKIVYSNIEQLPLFPELTEKNTHSSESDSTWILLYHIDEEDSEMRMELSLPVGFNENKSSIQIHKWEKRIVLPPVQFDSFVPPSKPEFTPEVEIEIKRRANE